MGWGVRRLLLAGHVKPNGGRSIGLEGGTERRPDPGGLAALVGFVSGFRVLRWLPRYLLSAY